MARKQAPFAAPQREDTMKIDAVEVTLFAWDDIPPTRYTQGTHNTSGRSNLGLLRIGTDDGIEGHAFLGSAVNPAETDAGALIRFLKPVLMGKDALARRRALRNRRLCLEPDARRPRGLCRGGRPLQGRGMEGL